MVDRVSLKIMGAFDREIGCLRPCHEIVWAWSSGYNNDKTGKDITMILIAIGIVLAVLGVWLWRRAVKNRAGRVAWLATRGSIVSSGVTREEVPGENGGSFDRFNAYYTYAIDGTPQRGSV